MDNINNPNPPMHNFKPYKKYPNEDMGYMSDVDDDLLWLVAFFDPYKSPTEDNEELINIFSNTQEFEIGEHEQDQAVLNFGAN